MDIAAASGPFPGTASEDETTSRVKEEYPSHATALWTASRAQGCTTSDSDGHGEAAEVLLMKVRDAVLRGAIGHQLGVDAPGGSPSRLGP